jgi:signal transduction histidine kinase
VAALFLAVSQLQVWTIGGYDQPVVVALATLLVAFAIAMRRRAPVTAVIVIGGYFAATFVDGVSNTSDEPSFPGAVLLLDPDVTLLPAATVLLASYAVAAHAELRRALAGLALLIVPLIVLTVVEGVPAQELLVAVGGIVCAWLVGWRMRQLRHRAAALADRAATLEFEQDERASAARAAERARIARELHDIVANGLTVIVLQAAAERRVVPAGQESTHAALETIEGTGRQALLELRRLLGMLRSEDDGLDLAPPPTMRNVAQLLDQVREAGMPVELREQGEARHLPPGVDLSAYRIVQEALTNALKHAGRASATVSVRYGNTELGLEIADNGQGLRDRQGAGHGLVGMRERAQLFGGHLEVGNRPEGGCLVRVRFPLDRGSQ